MYIANVNFLWFKSGPMKSIPLLFALTASALAAEPVELFNGKNLTGWKAPTGTWTAVRSVGLDQCFEILPAYGFTLALALKEAQTLRGQMDTRGVAIDVEILVGILRLQHRARGQNHPYRSGSHNQIVS